MHKAFGIVNTTKQSLYVDGMQDYRPIGAFSFLGRYRIMDFPISNMSNSGIDRIQLYVDQSPRSVVEHVGTGRHYNINSKSGRIQVLFASEKSSDIYKTDISNFKESLEYINLMHQPYVVIAPSNMVYKQDFDALINQHETSGADISILYHAVDNAKDHFLSCDTLVLNKQKGVDHIEKNRGTVKNKNISMETYVMKKELFIQLIEEASAVSSLYTLSLIINDKLSDLDVRGIAHKGVFVAITDIKSYFDANLMLTDSAAAKQLFGDPDWPIYTKTNDSCPTHYHKIGKVRGSVISNGCDIEGTVENSVIGRGVKVKKGALVKNSVILAETVVGENAVVENMVIDKGVKILKVKELKGTPEQPGYAKRLDNL
ncbi:MAG: glucose-1-phosphate adenylyltransferase subunit GlgD [Blautia sp.]|nr:glucose-1-phosphate adenylyltransferase subunit GlgD [Blautia sp.]